MRCALFIVLFGLLAQQTIASRVPLQKLINTTGKVQAKPVQSHPVQAKSFQAQPVQARHFQAQPRQLLYAPGVMPQQVTTLPHFIAHLIHYYLLEMVKGDNFVMVVKKLGYMPLDLIARFLAEAGEPGSACREYSMGYCNRFTDALVVWISNFKNGKPLDEVVKYMQNTFVDILETIQV